MTKSRKRRVIIGATCFSDADSAIGIASRFAAQIEGELAGLLVEDDLLLNLLQSSLATTIIDASGVSRPATGEAMRRAFRRDAKAFERRLAEVAGEISVGFAFELKKGDLIRTVEQSTRRDDLVVLGHQRIGKERSEVVLIGDLSLSDDALVDLSAKIADQMHLPLSVLLLSSKTRTSLANANQFKTNLSDSSATNVVEIKSSEEIRTFLDNRSPTVVVIACRDERIDVSTILSAARAPLVLPAPHIVAAID